MPPNCSLEHWYRTRCRLQPFRSLPDTNTSQLRGAAEPNGKEPKHFTVCRPRQVAHQPATYNSAACNSHRQERGERRLNKKPKDSSTTFGDRHVTTARTELKRKSYATRAWLQFTTEGEYLVGYLASTHSLLGATRFGYFLIRARTCSLFFSVRTTFGWNANLITFAFPL